MKWKRLVIAIPVMTLFYHLGLLHMLYVLVTSVREIYARPRVYAKLDHSRAMRRNLRTHC